MITITITQLDDRSLWNYRVDFLELGIATAFLSLDEAIDCRDSMLRGERKHLTEKDVITLKELSA